MSAGNAVRLTGAAAKEESLRAKERSDRDDRRREAEDRRKEQDAAPVILEDVASVCRLNRVAHFRDAAAPLGLCK